ncbi:hypothetical protein KSC_063580 [Ktedonobacter sp. SOSP1-52]|nr:hypothetical protein KSC_063580 [Ktedonobacter sp. SOSP1-52]
MAWAWLARKSLRLESMQAWTLHDLGSWHIRTLLPTRDILHMTSMLKGKVAFKSYAAIFS